jgi:NADH-quinone oxidoreductase subunit G
MINLEIDSKPVSVENGKTVMDAANALGIYIPHFCYHKKLSIAANCRMCLVQVEKAPKPLPACATPATEGMKVFTHSDAAAKAQKGVMEFLLINHPLDCPICDQGGECQLQDLSVGYGGSGSRFGEEKRVVVNKDLGPLISTDMTRCIHCTRCVRFGEEIAGVMELGMINRGEHSEIIQFVGTTVDSELSGNVIDLCPVGALTSKPFRFSARTWEMSRKPSISPHCGLGSNLTVQTKNNKVMRVLPAENEAVNECWLSDKDRFSYEGLNSPERLKRPMVNENGAWREVDWQYALNFVANGLKQVAKQHGAEHIGALSTPHQTLEEMYLLQKLLRALGSNNVDFRLRQSDFGADGKLIVSGNAASGSVGVPWLGMPIADINRLESVLIVGSSLRTDHPLIAHRLRDAAKRGARLHLLHTQDQPLAIRNAMTSVVFPSKFEDILEGILAAVCAINGVAHSARVSAGALSEAHRDWANDVAQHLIEKGASAVFLGNFAQQHPQAARLHALAQEIARITQSKFGFLGEAANSVGGHVARALPYSESGAQGLNALRMLSEPRKAYVLLGAEPELDCHDPAAAMGALKQADLVVALSAYRHQAEKYAHVMLPIAPFTETAGTFVSTEGRVQHFNGAVVPLAETRPAWKVLRVLGNLLGLSGFEHDSVENVRQEIAPDLQAHVTARLSNAIDPGLTSANGAQAMPAGKLERITEINMYETDAVVRRASALHATRTARAASLAVNRALFTELKLRPGGAAAVRQGACTTTLPVTIDDHVPAGCVRIAGARPETAALGPMFGAVELEAV